MAFCHACGLEVAEIDVFCPYCGVSLEPVSLPGGGVHDAFANTIVIEQPGDGAGDEVIGEHAAETKPEPVGEGPGDDVKAGGDDFAGIPTPLFIERGGTLPENTAEEVKVDDIAPPGGVEAAADTADDLLAEADDRIVESSEPRPLETAADTGEMDGPAPGEREEVVSAVVHTSEEVTDSKEIERSGETFAPIAEEVGAGELQETGPPEDCGDEIDDVVLAPVAETGDPVGQVELSKTVQQESDDAMAEAKSSGNLYAEIKPFPDEGIAMPLEALDAPEEYTPPALFDSVRIMDSDPIGNTAPPPVSDTRDAEDPPQPEPVQNTTSPGTPESDKDNRSYTTPNIGGSDTDGKKSSKLKPLDEGIVLNGRYEIVRKIGGGGMGAVYLASDNNLGGVLRAVKEMVQAHIEEALQDKAINDFRRESMILSTLDHPSIPTIYDYFFDDTENRFYLVMKYISGGDLSSRLRAVPEGRIDERTITEWAIQIADVLDYLHNRPSTIVYRDLKPSNVMLDGNTGRVMLIDFGIARSINQVEEKGVTAVGTISLAETWSRGPIFTVWGRRCSTS
jgi:tRNA A-37 threonylcarbamoyl transferase component Bud32